MTRIPFDPDAIRALAAVLSETGLTEIEIADKDSRIRVVRAAAPSVVAAAPVLTPVAAFVGLTEVTVGGVVSDPILVVKTTSTQLLLDCHPELGNELAEP